MSKAGFAIQMQVDRLKVTSSCQAAVIYYDDNLVAWQFQHQSLVALSSAEAELMASVWSDCLGLSMYGQLNGMIIEKPAYVAYCDNAALVQLSQQLAASNSRRRRVSMRAACLHHLVRFENASTQYVRMNYQRAEILTKSLSVYVQKATHKELRLQVRDDL